MNDLLKSYFEPELIEFRDSWVKYKKAFIKHNKNLKIINPPKILILSLLKTNPLANNKNLCNVNFQEENGHNEFLNKDLNRNEKFFYNLYGVVITLVH